VDVTPAQTEDPAAAQARIEHRPEHDPCLLAPRSLCPIRLVGQFGERPLDSADLGRRQDRPAPTRLPRPLHKRYWVRRDKAAPQRRLKQRREHIQVPMDRPRLEPRPFLVGHVPLKLVYIDRHQLQ
jgi:hypothetical protein